MSVRALPSSLAGIQETSLLHQGDAGVLGLLGARLQPRWTPP